MGAWEIPTNDFGGTRSGAGKGCSFPKLRNRCPTATKASGTSLPSTAGLGSTKPAWRTCGDLTRTPKKASVRNFLRLCETSTGPTFACQRRHVSGGARRVSASGGNAWGSKTTLTDVRYGGYICMASNLWHLIHGVIMIPQRAAIDQQALNHEALFSGGARQDAWPSGTSPTVKWQPGGRAFAGEIGVRSEVPK